MKVLVTGANGQLGRALAPLLPDAVMADRQTLDISDRSSVDAFDFTGIEAIINAAAYTKVDAAETEPGLTDAWRNNVEGVAHLAAKARTLDIPLVHVSSDYVFDGKAETPIPASAPVNPQGAYGLGKAASELAARLAPKHYVIRTSWVFGDGGNFVRTMLKLAESRPELSVVDDQVGRPTHAGDLAKVIVGLLDQAAPFGTYHATGSGDVVSWAQFAATIFKEAGANCTVKPITTAEYLEGKTGIAPRPAYSALDLSAIEQLGLKPRDWRESLAEYIKTMNEG